MLNIQLLTDLVTVLGTTTMSVTIFMVCLSSRHTPLSIYAGHMSECHTVMNNHVLVLWCYGWLCHVENFRVHLVGQRICILTLFAV